MFSDSLFAEIISSKSPLQPLLDWIVQEYLQNIYLSNLSKSIITFEEEISEFEQWIDKVWGEGFYKILLGDETTYSLPLALEMADPNNSNILICDGFSIRETFRSPYQKPGQGPYPVRSIFLLFHGF